jgi:hypothetical protein
MPNLVPTTVGYVQAVLWKGSVGANTKQQIDIEATSGTFNIKLFDSVNGVQYSATTEDIAYDATAETVVNAITKSASFLTASDIIVTKIDDTASANHYRYTIEFVGNFAKVPVQQVQLVTNKLSLKGDLIVTRFQTGLGISERQRMSMINVSSGFYYLTVTIGGVTETTAAIPHDASEVAIEQALINLNNVKFGDIFVRSDTLVNNEYRAYTFSFSNSFGNVTNIEPVYVNTLLCDPFDFGDLPGPPYDYPWPRPKPSENVIITPEDCCTIEKAGSNIVDMISYEREMVNPYTSVNNEVITVQRLAAIKRVDLKKYNAYTRNYKTNVMTPVCPSTQIANGMSVIFVEKEVDTALNQSAIRSHLSKSKEIMPLRMTWE